MSGFDVFAWIVLVILLSSAFESQQNGHDAIWLEQLVNQSLHHELLDSPDGESCG